MLYYWVVTILLTLALSKRFCTAFILTAPREDLDCPVKFAMHQRSVRGGFSPLAMAPDGEKTINEKESDTSLATSVQIGEEKPNLDLKLIREKFRAFREMTLPYYTPKTNLGGGCSRG